MLSRCPQAVRYREPTRWNLIIILHVDAARISRACLPTIMLLKHVDRMLICLSGQASPEGWCMSCVRLEESIPAEASHGDGCQFTLNVIIQYRHRECAPCFAQNIGGSDGVLGLTALCCSVAATAASNLRQ